MIKVLLLLLIISFCQRSVTLDSWLPHMLPVGFQTYINDHAHKNCPNWKPPLLFINGTIVYSDKGELFKQESKQKEGEKMVTLASSPLSKENYQFPCLSSQYLLDNNRKTIETQHKEYFLANLGFINGTWDTDQYENFTTTIDNIHFYNNLAGLVIMTNFSNENDFVNNLPFLKASIRDIKKYLVANSMREIAIGTNFLDYGTISKDVETYLTCGNNYTFDFYYDSANLLQIINKSETINCDHNPWLTKLTDHLPFKPTASRCDCLMSVLKCMINPQYPQFQQQRGFQDIDQYTVESKKLETLKDICNVVYCGCIENDVENGNYGLFASCSTNQKLSIALNLYYSFYNNDKNYCNWDGLSKLTSFNYSIDEYQKLFDFSGKSCKQEIKNDWNSYLKGTAKNNVNLTKINLEYIVDIGNDDDDCLAKNTIRNHSNKLGDRIQYSYLYWLLILYTCLLLMLI